MTPPVRLSRFSRNLLITALLVIFSALTFTLYVQSIEHIIHTHELRYRSFQLADELRQSSDDPTRMVRTYVVTGNPVYKQYYQDILDIRNGKKPRPEAYSRIYWDLVLPGAKPPRPASQESIALLERMRQAGFTEPEFRKLAEAKANSDRLTATELEAMRLFESGSPETEASRSRARMMLYDEPYHRAKAAIMKPIDEFYDLLDKRTLDAVQAAENRAANFRYLFIALSLALLSMLWRSYTALHDTLGDDLDAVYAQIAKIGSGDFSAAISGLKVTEDRRNSVVGWLHETQLKLSEIERERKQVEMLARANELKYRTLLEHLPQKVFAKDRDSVYLHCNENFARDLHLRPEEFAGHSDYDFFPKELADKYRADDIRLMASGSTETLEEKYLLNGEERWVSTVKTPLHDEQGNISGILGIFWDITDRKRAEEQIRQLNAELEQRVQQRTAQLEAANMDLENFSYSVSHDLRAPLRAIDGFAGILREEYADKLDKEGLRLFKVVSDNAQKMAQLIDDILAFSRAGRTELKLSKLDMHALVQQVWQELEPRRAGRNIELQLTELPAVSGDPAAIHQVWQNLLDNAIKFTRGREPAVIGVSCRREENEVIYSVSDNGAGFDMSYTNKLFGLFQRLHGMEEFEGTGVGLAIVKRFIAKHGGRVWADGRVGTGATFCFSLPAQTDAAEKEIRANN